MTHHESHSTTDQTRKHNDKDSSELSQKAKETAQEARMKARETASEVADEAKQQTRELSSAAKEEARSMVETRKSQVTSELDNIAQAFRTSSRELKNRNEAPVARYANTIADRLEDASSYLSGRSVDDLLTDAEDFARQQPELFLGGAFGLGLLISRFFKSSESNLYASSDRYSPSRYGSGAYNRGAMDYGTQRRSSDWDTRYSGTGRTATTDGSGTQGTGARGTEVRSTRTGAAGTSSWDTEEGATGPRRSTTPDRGDSS